MCTIELIKFYRTDQVLLPPANEVCEGYGFTRVCHSVDREGGGIPECLTGGIPACLAGLQGGLQAHTQGGG